jgi:hypothetical protein
MLVPFRFRTTSTPHATSRRRRGPRGPGAQLVARGEFIDRGATANRRGPGAARFVAHGEAVRAVRALKQGTTVGVAGARTRTRALRAGRACAGARDRCASSFQRACTRSPSRRSVHREPPGFAVADERTEPVKEPDRCAWCFWPARARRRWRRRPEDEAPPPKAVRKGAEDQQSAPGENFATSGPLKTQIRRSRSTRSPWTTPMPTKRRTSRTRTA